MKKVFTFVIASALCYGAFAQVQIDQQIQLTGSGSAAKVTGIDEVSQPSDATSAKVVQNGSLNYAPATGTGDNIVVSLAPAPSSYAAGMIVNFKSSAANTGPASIDVNGLGQVDIKKSVTDDLEADDIKNGQMVSVIYDGTYFQLMYSGGASGGGGGLPVGTCVTTLNPIPPLGYTNTGSFFVSTAGWASKSVSGSSYDGGCMAAYNNRLYFIGGQSWMGPSDVLHEYDPSTNTWTPKASMLSGRGRGFAATAVVNGKIYIFGGQNNGGYTDQVDEYDPATNSWATKTSMPTARRFLAAGVVNNKVYVIGGGNYSPTTAVEEYDPATDTWTTMGSMPSATEYMTAVSYNNLLYVIGGSNGSTGVQNAYTYDPSGDTWTPIADAPLENNYSYSAALINGKIYLTAGEHTYEYDPATDNYVTKTPPLSSVSYFVPAVAINNKMYVCNGNAYNMEYDPSADRTMYIHCP